MFRKFKQWFQQERYERSTSTMEIFQSLEDPREIPRPDRFFANYSIKKLHTNTENKTDPCICKNCLEVSDCFAECMICMEPLQSAGISSCVLCGHYSCWNCCQKVINCPFCRASFISKENYIRNYAMERILLKLELPCRHARWGCKMNVGHKERITHEESCLYAPSGCPLVKFCGWNGGPTNIIKHLKDKHGMTLIAATDINIEIVNFKLKMVNLTPHYHNLALVCHGNIFICKVRMSNKKLHLIFFQITGETSPKEQKFEAVMEITTASQILNAEVEISPKHKNNKEIVIPGETLLLTKTEHAGSVRISITIKPL